MQHRVLVLGNTGMLGHMVEHVLAADARFEVRGIGRTEFDVEQCESGARGKTSGVELAPTGASGEEQRDGKHSMLRSARQSLDALLTNVDFVINCIGITARHIDDADPESVARAIRVNAEFPHALAAAARAHGVRVMHMSTDGVFSGTKSFSPSRGEGERLPAEALAKVGEGVGGMTPSTYTESDVPDAVDTYGRTKALGESRASNVLNIRASIIGPSPYKHEGLWEWAASQQSGSTVDGHTNHLWHGVTTMQFVEFCRRVIVEDRFDVLRSGGPVLHLAPNHPILKHDLLCAIADALGKQMTVRPIAHGQPVQRVLAVRSDVAAMFGEPQSIAAALHACVIAYTR